MPKVELTKLIEGGAHFGHLTRRWNPKMKPYIFMEKNGIHIIDLKKTQKSLEQAYQAMADITSEGKKVLFVGTKKQAKEVIAEEARRSESNWVSERWLGGMLTNFATIRKSIKRMQNIDKMESDGTFEKVTKKEILFLNRERDKLRKVLSGIETMNKLPGAMFIVDIKKEAIAVNEALRLNIPIFAIVDTNCDPDVVDYVIPSNDDAVRAIEIITKVMADAILEGQSKAKELKAEEAAEQERTRKETETEDAEGREPRAKVRKVKFDRSGKKERSRSGQGDRPQRAQERKEVKEEDTVRAKSDVKTVDTEKAPAKEDPSMKEEKEVGQTKKEAPEGSGEEKKD